MGVSVDLIQKGWPWRWPGLEKSPPDPNLQGNLVLFPQEPVPWSGALWGKFGGPQATKVLTHEAFLSI